MRGRTFALFAFVGILAGCGGGGGSGGSTSPIPAPPNLTAAASQAIVAGTGGTVAASLNGETVTLNVPAGALSTSTTVGLTVYARAALPRTFQAHLRQAQALPGGAAFIVAMNVTIGSATLLRPLTFTVTGAPAVAANTVVRLAGSRQGAFGDIDTATQTNGTINEAQSPAYAGVSLAGPPILFAFYSVAPANAAAPPAVALSVVGPTTVIGGTQAHYTTTEIDANGFPFLNSSATFSLDSAAIGSIDPLAGVLTAATANNSSGHVIASDRKNPAITGSLAISVLSSRPATAGDSLSYTGTFASSIVNNAIGSAPVTTTQAGSVTQTVAVSAVSAGQAVLATTEADNFELSSLITKTTSTLAYQTSAASTAVRLVNSSATDSNNVTYATQYTPTSGLLAIEPETPGLFGPNDASQTYTETDPGINVGPSGQGTTTTRTTVSSGAYQEATTNADGSVNAAVQNADGSGTYSVDSGLAQVTFGAATPTARNIPITVVLNNGTPQTEQLPAWYPLPIQLYAEYDAIAASTAYDPHCNVPAKYGTTASRVTQTIAGVDVVFGNLENQTTTTYDVAGVGTVCSIFTDTTQTFYDYTGQEPAFIAVSGAQSPILSSSAIEVLSITGGTVSGQPISTDSRLRSTLSVGRLPVVIARERFRHAVRQAKLLREARLATALKGMKGVH